MVRQGTRITFNPAFFDQIMKSAGVDSLIKERAEAVKKVAESTAPVDTGEYRDSIQVRQRDTEYRRTYQVEASDPKALLIEAKTGNLARALKRAGRG